MSRLVIFDCDGTLVDSGHSIHLALGETFAEHGRPIPPRDVARRVIGLSLDEAFASLAPDGDGAEHRVLSATYRRVFAALRARGSVEEPLFEGIVPLLDALEADGWLLAVATGKSDRGLHHCLQVNGLGGRFVSLQTADRHPSKPHPSMAMEAMLAAGAEPADTVVIGDTGWDMGMAKAAGAKAMGALWGYHDAAELKVAGADVLVARPADVHGEVRRLFGEVEHG
ncbi:HAD hydrolase-like protein [Sphingomonas sp. BN140010]|uniref:HAD hydrolase-like protein n=1 Tax=Sphingomonas arvum TaxID=2992113 RepID=A0ABT3JGE3_9SPHN|nr:HAD hydrolase-like protein [Sphingomonas sp. BN140010]MCW3798157.1 HAD hydrolase-like protein [Sphingomonas sp. BN140010]